MEFWHIMLAFFVMWFIYSMSKPIVRPSIIDIRFKRMIERQIDEGLKYKTHHGFDSIITTEIPKHRNVE